MSGLAMLVEDAYTLRTLDFVTRSRARPGNGCKCGRPDESECARSSTDECADRILGDGPEDHARVPVLMDTLPPKPTSSRSGSRIPLSPTSAVQLAIMFGLCGGYLDLFLMLFRNLLVDPDRWILRSRRDFLWTVPAAHVVLMLIPGMLIAAAVPPSAAASSHCAWGRGCSRRSRSGRPCSRISLVRRRLACSWPPGSVGRSAARSWPHGRSRRTVAIRPGGAPRRAGCPGGASRRVGRCFRSARAVAGLPPPPTGARNVILIVWDTVRAYDLSLYGYSRNTTPNLARWARKGVRYNHGPGTRPVDVPLS